MRTPELLPDDIKAYLVAENSYCNAALADTESLQQQLVAEMRSRIQEDDDSLPDRDGTYYYADRYVEGAEHPIYYRYPSDASATDRGAEQILLDINIEAGNHDYFDHDLVEHSPDHSTLAWSCDTSGAEYYELRFRNLQTGIDSPHTISDVDSAAWANASTLFYARVDENHRPSKVYRHTLGSDPHTDVLVFEETDPRFTCGVECSLSGEYLFIHTGMNDQDEVWFIATASVTDKPQMIEPRSDGLEYSVDHQGSRFLILTNADNAIDFAIMETSVAQPAMKHWRDLVPHRQGRMIRYISCYRDWLMWIEVENALPQICFMGADQKTLKIGFDEEAYSLGLMTGLEYNACSFRYEYSSPTTPPQIFEYQLTTGNRKLLKEDSIPRGHNSADYITRRILATSHDGAEVPVTLLHHRDTPIDGTAPCLLYGYGSYGASVPAEFSGNRLSLVDRGFIYAIAHVRGGQEKGRGWYEEAKFAKKVNSFHDFIAASEALIEKRYTHSDKLVIEGGSAGGLLVAAAVNMRPTLFAGAIADVPFVDVLNTISDDTLPLTPGEWSQWGNPIESKQAFEDIRGYSPYDNIEAKDYPPMLVTAGVSDPRVTYWEPAKWVAGLRDQKTDNNVLLLKTNMSSGHYGKTGRFAELDDSALSYVFAISITAS